MSRVPSVAGVRRAAARRLRRAIVAANAGLGGPVTRIPDGSNAVLMYHSVGNPAFSADVPPAKLRADLAFLTGSSRIRVVDLPEVTEPSAGVRKVAVTFDDGYRNVATEVLPVLEAFDVPATVFLNPALVGDRDREAVEAVHGIDADERILLTDSEVATLAREPNVTVGNHTRSHQRLDELDDATLREEVVAGKRLLESAFDVAVDRFCYPYGRYDERAVEVVRDHHDYAVTTYPFAVTADDSRYELPRIPGNLPTPDLLWEVTRLSDALPLRDERMANIYPD